MTDINRQFHFLGERREIQEKKKEIQGVEIPGCPPPVLTHLYYWSVTDLID